WKVPAFAARRARRSGTWRVRSDRRPTFGKKAMDQQKLDKAIGRRLKTVRLRTGRRTSQATSRRDRGG
ncbi:MAG: hypothetical protein KGM94_23955, partial [Bradyrhizobium sp.]|nr:hypothetical protein [Bradyrhizobium sp.]